MKAIKSLHIFAYLILLLPKIEANSTSVALWKNQGFGKRFVYDGTILKPLKLSPILCGVACIQFSGCKSFNARNASEDGVSCELLSASRNPPKVSHLQADSTWNYYVVHNPCPPNSVFVPYDVPDDVEYDDPIDIEGYTCVNNGWIYEQHALGKRDCRFQLLKFTEFGGYDAPNYGAVVAPFYDALSACLENDCIGSVCDGAMAMCWLKTKAPEETSRTEIPNDYRHFWKMVCN